MSASLNAEISSTKTKWRNMNILSYNQFDRERLNDMCKVTNAMRAMVATSGGCDLLKGKILNNVFFEPSTRTMCSFETAMQRLGGTTVRILPSYSSSKKGETLQDTLRCLECYGDITVLRHPEKGSVPGVAKYLKKPLLNAGDGVGEHPTQALLDFYTIQNEMDGKVDGLTIVLLGDLKNGRTVHSLARLLMNYDVKLRFVSPESLKMPEYIKEEVQKKLEFTEHENLSDVLKEADVLYVTRVQKERFENQEDYLKVKGTFDINKATLSIAKENMIIMHPLPRVGEIHEDVDSDPRAAYFRQMENGMYVRMSLLALCLKGRGDD